LIEFDHKELITSKVIPVVIFDRWKEVKKKRKKERAFS